MLPRPRSCHSSWTAGAGVWAHTVTETGTLNPHRCLFSHSRTEKFERVAHLIDSEAQSG